MEGMPVGISSGTVIWVAAELAKHSGNVGKTTVVPLSDACDRYLSTLLGNRHGGPKCPAAGMPAKRNTDPTQSPSGA